MVKITIEKLWTYQDFTEKNISQFFADHKKKKLWHVNQTNFQIMDLKWKFFIIFWFEDIKKDFFHYFSIWISWTVFLTIKNYWKTRNSRCAFSSVSHKKFNKRKYSCIIFPDIDDVFFIYLKTLNKHGKL